MNPSACAKITGNSWFPDLSGNVTFYKDPSGGVWVEIEVAGLPDYNSPTRSSFYALHIHEFGNCTPPFDETGDHYNPTGMPHPGHAGDMPPLLGNNGYAYSLFYTERLNINDILNRSIVIHSMADDFTSQPSGNSGEKIGCGIIKRCDH